MTTIIIANPENETRVLLVRVNSLYAAGYEPAFEEVLPGERRLVLLNGTYGEQVEVLVGRACAEQEIPETVYTEPKTVLPESESPEVTGVTESHGEKESTV